MLHPPSACKCNKRSNKRGSSRREEGIFTKRVPGKWYSWWLWCFHFFFNFHPYLGKWSDLTTFFSDGLKTQTSINNSMWAGNESKTLAKLTYSRGNSTIMQPLQKVFLMNILYEWKTIPRSIIHWLMINIWRQTSACWKHISIVFSWAPWGSPEYQHFEVSWFMDARQLFVESVLYNS